MDIEKLGPVQFYNLAGEPVPADNDFCANQACPEVALVSSGEHAGNIALRFTAINPGEAVVGTPAEFADLIAAAKAGALDGYLPPQ